MPLTLQRLKARDELKRKGIEPDLVDVDALIDPSLSYPENFAIILKESTGSSKRHATTHARPNEEEAQEASLTALQRAGLVHVHAYNRHLPGHAHDHPRCVKCALHSP